MGEHEDTEIIEKFWANFKKGFSEPRLLALLGAMIYPRLDNPTVQKTVPLVIATGVASESVLDMVIANNRKFSEEAKNYQWFLDGSKVPISHWNGREHKVESTNDEQILETGQPSEVSSKQPTTILPETGLYGDPSRTNRANDPLTTLESSDAEKAIVEQSIKNRQRAWQDLLNQSAKGTAELLGDKQKLAEAEYNITLTSLAREREKQLLAIQENKDDKKAQLAVDSWYNDQVELAMRKRLLIEGAAIAAERAAKLEAFDWEVQANQNLADMQIKTQLEIDTLNKQVLDNKLAAIDKILSSEQAVLNLSDAEIKNLLNMQARTTVQSGQIDQRIASQDPARANSVAIAKIKNETVDYSNTMVDAWHKINTSAEDHWVKMLSGQESFSQGMKSITKDLTQSITQMWIKMMYQQYIYKPLQNLFTNMIGGSTAVNFTPKQFDMSSTWTKYDSYTPKISLGNTAISPNANGGPVSAGGLYLVGEKQPELFVPDQSGRIYPSVNSFLNQQPGSAAAPSVTVNVYDRSGSNVQVSKQARWDGGAQRMIVEMFIDAKERNVMGLRDALAT